jgi:hypothetical protein
VVGVDADRLELADPGDRVPPGVGERGERPVGRDDDPVALGRVVRLRRKSAVLVACIAAKSALPR